VNRKSSDNHANGFVRGCEPSLTFIVTYLKAATVSL